MKQNHLNKRLSKRIKKCLDQVLHIEANTSSCAYIFQPKAPEELKNFKVYGSYKDEKKNRDLAD